MSKPKKLSKSSNNQHISFTQSMFSFEQGRLITALFRQHPVAGT
jgi:hypothetical protein